MRRILLFVLLSACLPPLFSQKTSLKTKFGKISEEEIAMKSCPIDADAPAVVLFDKGEVTNSYLSSTGFNIEFSRHIRIKIFNKTAYDLANAAIFYFSSQKIYDLKAVCYNVENGKLVETELEKANIFDEKITRSRLLRKFSIPAVREGSIIEYKYRLVSSGDIGLPTDEWAFQRIAVPTLWSEFESSIPTFIDYGKISQGWVPFLVAEESEATEKIPGERIEYNVKRMHFIQQNVPALKPEPHVGSLNDYLSKIFFDIKTIFNIDVVPSGGIYRITNGMYKEYNNTWIKLGKEMLEDAYQDPIKSSKYTENLLKECIVQKVTPADKTAGIYEYIGKNFTVREWDYVWMTQEIEKLTKERKGTPTELNILFINLLRKADITAWPVMISTRSHGHIHPARVSPDAFDRVIAAVDLGEKEPLLIDVTSYPNPIGLLDEEDLNQQGLVLKSKEFIDWMPLQSSVGNRSAVMGELQIKPEGGLSGKVSYSESGYGSVINRQQIKEKDARHALSQHFAAWATEGKFSELTVQNAENWQDPTLKMDFNLETSGHLTASGNKYYLDPTLGLGNRENPFKNPERKFNIDFGAPHDETYIFTYKIPAGYKVEEAPKSAKVTFAENGLSFEYRIDQTPEQLKLLIKLRFRTTYIGATEYESLKQFYTAMLSKMEEQVVLTKL
jgi:hypothetical protein